MKRETTMHDSTATITATVPAWHDSKLEALCKSKRHNTRHEPGAVILHKTAVFTIECRDDSPGFLFITLNTGGWLTRTTCTRMQEAFRAIDVPAWVSMAGGELSIGLNCHNWKHVPESTPCVLRLDCATGELSAVDA